MRRIFIVVSLLSLAAGCGGSVARLDGFSRVRSAVLTDANAFSQSTQGSARPPIEVVDSDRLAALDKFVRARERTWRKLEGTPRATRFQLELRGDGRTLYTLWLEPGYVAMAQGKKMREARLSNAETAELLACLGLPPDYLGFPSAAVDYGPPNVGVSKGPPLTPNGAVKR